MELGVWLTNKFWSSYYMYGVNEDDKLEDTGFSIDGLAILQGQNMK